MAQEVVQGLAASDPADSLHARKATSVGTAGHVEPIRRPPRRAGAMVLGSVKQGAGN